MRAIFVHELKNYFHTMTAWLFAAFLLLFVGIGSMLYNLQAAVANFEYVLQFVCLGLVLFIPVLTMKSVSEEKKQKTDQLLYSLPVTSADIVLGKYFAMVTVFAVPVVIICIYPLVFSLFGDVYLPTSYGSIFAFLLMAAAMIAAGEFISSLTESQGFAAGITIALFLFNYYSVSLADYVSSSYIGAVISIYVLVAAASLIIGRVTRSMTAGSIFCAVCIAALLVVTFVDSRIFEGLLPSVMSNLSLFERFYDFVNGIFNVADIVFYITVSVFFLFLTVQTFEKRRYN